jgi:hypothetical protein
VGRDLGDLQTPPELARQIVRLLRSNGACWPRVLEPTCGRGAFLEAVLQEFDPPPRELVGIELQEAHCREARRIASRPKAEARILHASLFDLDLRRDLRWKTQGRLLVLGNPPWITAADLGKLGSSNQAKRRPMPGLRGLDACTGAANFDLAAAVWLKLIEDLAGEQPTIALLCKTTVARGVLETALAAALPIASARLYEIDARRWFRVHASACLLRVEVGGREPPQVRGKKSGVTEARTNVETRRGQDITCPGTAEGKETDVLEARTDVETRRAQDIARPGTAESPAPADQPTHEAGIVAEGGRVLVFPGLHDALSPRALRFDRGRLVPDLGPLEGRAVPFPTPNPIAWRQGIKHDASRVMVLLGDDPAGPLRNGLGETVRVESDHLFPLHKASDLQHQPELRPRRWLLVPQRSLAADTRLLAKSAPRLWAYLQRHAAILDRRQSSIYRGRPPFSIFGVGPYSFTPFKVAISGLHRPPRFRALGPVAGRPVVLDDTCYLAPCHSAVEAAALAALCNHPTTLQMIDSLTFSDAKRVVTKRILDRIHLGSILARLDPDDLQRRMETFLELDLGFPTTSVPDHVELVDRWRNTLLDVTDSPPPLAPEAPSPPARPGLAR